jgi:hypothetical protein
MIYPYFNTLAMIVPKMEVLSTQIKSNVEKYKTLVDHYEEMKKDGNKEF